MAPVGPAPTKPIRAVLDTNIWLDLLVFRDASVSVLAEAMTDGHLQACMDEFGINELTRVLGYPLGRIRLDEAARAAVVAACRSLAPTSPLPGSEPPAVHAPLPQCRDRHDQPFLEFAQACKANWLITKDRDLLMLARRVSRQQPFAILSPQAAVRLLADGAVAATADDA